MRTTLLKIQGEKKEAVLVAGGSGFKIYSVSGFDGWVLKIGREVLPTPKASPDFLAVSKYVNLRYQPNSEQEAIKSTFNILIAKIIDQTRQPVIEPNL